jgi:hypothetical protein
VGICIQLGAFGGGACLVSEAASPHNSGAGSPSATSNASLAKRNSQVLNESSRWCELCTLLVWAATESLRLTANGPKPRIDFSKEMRFCWGAFFGSFSSASSVGA